jgi:hypothetical protein
MSFLSPNQKINLLYKKLLQVSDVFPDSTNLAVEPNRQNIQNIYYNSIYSQYIPVPAPSNDLVRCNTYYYSSNYPYIQFYSSLTLSSATAFNNTSFYLSNLQNIITPAFDLTYNYSIFANRSNNINKTSDINTFYIDPDAGTLTFFSTTVNRFSFSNPPTVTFYKYNGLKGNNTFLNIQNF